MAGSRTKGFTNVSDREWMIRAFFTHDFAAQPTGSTSRTQTEKLEEMAKAAVPKEKSGQDAVKRRKVSVIHRDRETKTGEWNAILRQGPGQTTSQELISKM